MSILERIEFDPEKVPLVKLVLHTVQILIAFVIWCLAIAVFRADKASITGDNGWTFGVCFLAVPAWIYLVGAPRWPRTRRLASPKAMVGVDGIFTIVWLSAFATQAAYNSAGQCGDACSLSKAIVGLGVFEFLFWVLTTFVSVYTLKYHQNNGRLPGYGSMHGGGSGRMGGSGGGGLVGGRQNIDPDKAAFSLAPHDDDAYTRLSNDDHDTEASGGGGGGSHLGRGSSSNISDDPYRLPTPSLGDPYGGGGSYVGAASAAAAAVDRPTSSYSGSDVAGFENPFHRARNNPFAASSTNLGTAADTAYGGGGGGASDLSDATNNNYGLAPYADASGPARFPAGNYDQIDRSLN